MVLLEIVTSFLAPFARLLDPPIRLIRDAVTSQSLRRRAVQITIACVVLGLLVGVSFVAYLVFYWMYIPQRGHVGQVHLQYDKFSASKGHVGPSAVVDFTKGGRYTQILRGEQAYDVSMKLVMPTSSSNVALGNFMVMVQLIGANGHVIITSSRSAIVTYESLLLRLLRTVWRAIPLVLRWTRESQTIRLPLIENFVESSSNPVAMALIEISNPNLQIYRTSLHIDAHFQGLRYFMYYYRVTTALIFMTAFIFWEIIFCILTWQTISAWIVGPATQALATMPRPMLHNSHDNLPPIRRGDQPQLQQYHYSLHDTDNDDSEDDFLIVNNSSSSRKEYSMETVAPTTERNVNTRHRPTPRRRNEQEDSDSAASDADSIFDAIVPQQRDIGASSSVARVPSAQLRSRKT